MTPKIESYSYRYGACVLTGAVNPRWLQRGKTWDNWLNTCTAIASENELTVSFHIYKKDSEWQMIATFRDIGDPRYEE